MRRGHAQTHCAPRHSRCPRSKIRTNLERSTGAPASHPRIGQRNACGKVAVQPGASRLRSETGENQGVNRQYFRCRRKWLELRCLHTSAKMPIKNIINKVSRKNKQAVGVVVDLANSTWTGADLRFIMMQEPQTLAEKKGVKLNILDVQYVD